MPPGLPIAEAEPTGECLCRDVCVLTSRQVRSRTDVPSGCSQCAAMSRQRSPAGAACRALPSPAVITRCCCQDCFHRARNKLVKRQEYHGLTRLRRSLDAHATAPKLSLLSTSQLFRSVGASTPVTGESSWRRSLTSMLMYSAVFAGCRMRIHKNPADSGRPGTAR